MSGTARRVTDRLEHEIEAALDPARFVPDGFCFADDLEEAGAAVATLVKAAPARAIALYEAFRAGCYENAEEVDDSSGSFAMLVTTPGLRLDQGRPGRGRRARRDRDPPARVDGRHPFGFC